MSGKSAEWLTGAQWIANVGRRQFLAMKADGRLIARKRGVWGVRYKEREEESMPTIMVEGTEITPGSIDTTGSEPMIGDVLDIGMAGKHRGRWRVVGREHRVTGPRCTMTFVYVQPLDARALAYCMEDQPIGRIPRTLPEAVKE